MAEFAWKGRSAAGEAVDGRLEAATPDAAARQLLDSGITPLDIAPFREPVQVGDLIKRKLEARKPGLGDIIMFSRQMYTLARAGIPMGRAIRGLAETTRNPVIQEALLDVADGLEEGKNLSMTMARYPQVFPDLYISIIQIGEESGKLDESFKQLALHYEREQETRARVKSALRYPSFVVMAIVSALVLINIFVIPQFARVFESFQAELPLATQILMSTSAFMVNYWPFLLAATVALFYGVKRWVETERGRYLWDRQKLRLPLVGGIVQRAILGRFAQSFALVLHSGVPFLHGLNLVSSAVGNVYVTDKLRSMSQGIERGDTLTRTAVSTGLFTPLVIQMLSVGEETGSVEELLNEVGDYYDREVDQDLKGLSAAIEPILLVGIGGIVLVLALGVFLPMWDLSSVVKSN